MEKLLQQRKDFNKVMELPSGTFPTLINESRWTLQRDLLIEEVEEYDEACREGNLVEVADALGDIMYLLIGAVTEHGLQECIREIMDEIQRSNMSKVQMDGTVLKREDGKVIKPVNFSKPDIRRIIQNHLNKKMNQQTLEL